MSKFRCESDFMTESKRIYRAYIDCEKQMKSKRQIKQYIEK